MSANPNIRAKHLTITAAGLIGIAAVAGAWVLPPPTDAGLAPSISVEPPATDAENTPAITIEWVDTRVRDRDDVHVNIPLGPIQDGQFCQAYAVVHVGSPPYHFEWSGQFDDTNAQPGPLGPKQIVNGFIDGFKKTLKVEVWQDTGKTEYIDYAEVTLEIDASYPYNPSCEA